jgi:TDG/mug DNA glycosylase family protein
MSRTRTRIGTRGPLRGLAPALGAQPRVLVLGSMPGSASLAQAEYYAHPRNDFWRIVEAVFAIPRERAYAARLAALNEAGVGVWDVLAECHRRGSLDAAIPREGRRHNDIEGVLAAHPGIVRVLLNGAFAADAFQRQVRAGRGLAQGVECIRLPSTSPANASIPYARKLALWREALLVPDGNGPGR